MAYSNGKITAPVGFTDIYQAIGDSSDMTRSTNINPWAKYKPVRRTFTLESRPSDWWKADDGWCGIDVSDAKVSSTSDVSNIILKFSIDKKNGWKHAAPRAGIDDSRPLDFEGYNHKAQPFVGSFTMPSNWAKDITDLVPVYFTLTEKVSNADYLTYYDLPFSNMYLGVALVNTSNSTIYRCTNETTIENSGFNVEFSAKYIEEGTYDVYPFISDKIMPLGTNDSSYFAANVYTVPNVSKKTLVIVEKSIVVTITCSYTLVTRLSYRISVTNNGSSAKTFSNNEVQVRYSSNKWSDDLLSDEKRIEGQPANFTVNAGTTYTVEGNVTGIGYALTQDSVLWVKLGSDWYSKNVDQTVKPLPEG